MPTRNEVLLRFQKDLQALNGAFEAELRRLDEDRLATFRGLPASRRLVEAAETKGGEALSERHLDRGRAAAAREKALTDAVKKRRDAFAAAERAWRRAEDEAEGKRDGKRADEARKHADELEKIDRRRPVFEQTLAREAEFDRHEKALARIEEDFQTALRRAREDYQTAQEHALAQELQDSEAAADAERGSLHAADTEYAQALEHAADTLHDALLALEEARDLERGFQQRRVAIRQRWDREKEALRAAFKADYDRAS